MQHIEEQRLKHIRRVTPSRKVECLKAAEGECVFGVVEEKSMLTAACPTLQAVLHRPDDVGEIGNGSLLGLQHVHALDRIPQLALLFEIEPVTLFIALDKHTEEAEEKLQVLFAGVERKWVDCEVARLL